MLVSSSISLDPSTFDFKWGYLTSSLALGVAIASGLIALGAARNQGPPADELRARRVVIVDDQSRDRIVLGTDGEEAAILLLDTSGKLRTSISVLPDGSSGFHVYDGSRKVVVELAALPNATSQLILWSSEKRYSATVAAGSEVVGLDLRDPGGRPIAAIQRSADGRRLVGLSDSRGVTRALLQLPPKGEASMELYDGTGRPVKGGRARE